MPENSSISWDEAKLKELIRDKIEENFTLEYKSAGALTHDSRPKVEITKDISAMANSAGGVLIYGLAEFQNDALKHLPEKIDPINRNDFSKEWLENIILQINPRIPDLKIHSVQLTSNSDHVAYMVEIPQGNTAHQANDCRYYRRFNFQSVPMPDNEVRDVMNRKSYPRISVEAKFVVYPRQNRDGWTGALVVEIHNESEVFARHVFAVFHSPLKVRGQPIVYERCTLDNGQDGHALKLEFSNHNGPPLFPHGTLKRIFYFKPSFGELVKESEKQLDHFRWVAFADSMPMQSGLFIVDEIYFQQS
jgi:Schlafen, AlbA_2